MADLRAHERIERLLAERPAVAREAAALRAQRASVRGRVRGLVTALAIGRIAGRFLRRGGRRRERSWLASILRWITRAD